MSDLTITGTDDALGVSVDTPLGQMWFERTDDAVEELAAFFPGCRVELTRADGREDSYMDGRQVL